MRMNAKELIAEARITSPTLPPAAAKLMSDMADRLDVQYAVIRESQAQLHAVVADNAALKAANEVALKILNDDETMVTSLWASSVQKVEVETPATDAAIAALRAEGVEMAIKEALSVDTVASTGAVKFVLQDFANKLRQSVQPASPAPLSAAITDIIAERQRQQAVEGWSPEHDDTHDKAEMVLAAISYLMAVVNPNASHGWWPWDAAWWKPTNPRRDLVKAGALIAAEIERIDCQSVQVKGDK